MDFRDDRRTGEAGSEAVESANAPFFLLGDCVGKEAAAIVCRRLAPFEDLELRRLDDRIVLVSSASDNEVELN
jgi:hypothetical protein